MKALKDVTLQQYEQIIASQQQELNILRQNVTQHQQEIGQRSLELDEARR